MTIRFLSMNRAGTILILGLWLLALLTFFVVHLSVGIRQKISLISRLEQNERIRLWAESGIHKAIAVLNEDLKQHGYAYTLQGKERRHNNPSEFKGIAIQNGICEVSFLDGDDPHSEGNIKYGFVDESSKINLNNASQESLLSLFSQVLDVPDYEAESLVESILEWQGRLNFSEEGKSSRAYYESLEHPFPMRTTSFEAMDELRLVKGMTEERFSKLFPFITIYGSNAVNVNTASGIVLRALGVSLPLTEKILRVRRGWDGVDGTKDDFVFQDREEVLKEIKSSFDLPDDEYNELMVLINTQRLDVNSRYYSIHSTAHAVNASLAKQINCVFDASQNRIVYWQEN